MDLESQIGALAEAVELLQKSVSCTICLEIMVIPTRTKCGHSFCHECILTVINTNRMANCPLCNTKINRRTVKENEKAKIMVEKVITLINSIGKDIGMDISSHAKIPKSTQEALLRSPKVQRVLKQSKLESITPWQKSDLKCLSKSEKEHSQGQQREKSPELVSVSQVLVTSPSVTDENSACDIRKNIEEVPRKKKVAEWLDKTFDTMTSVVKSSETADKGKLEQLTVVADVHKMEGEDLKSAAQQRVRCYRITKKKAMVFTDADKITVNNHSEENTKKRKVEARDENEIQNAEAENMESDPYVFIGSQKTSVKTTRKSLRQKDKENKSASASSDTQAQKKKPKIISSKPIPVRYNESQTLSVDIYDTFDKLVVTANKIQPPVEPEEEHSDSNDTVFLFRTPLEDNNGPNNLEIPLSFSDIKLATDVIKRKKLESCDSIPDKKRKIKAGCERRTRSADSKSPVKTASKLESIHIPKEPQSIVPKAIEAASLSPSKKVNQTVNSITLADVAIKNIPAVKSLIMDEAMKQEMQLLEKEKLSDIILPATPNHIVNVSKLNATSGTKSPGWSRISKSKKEFDKFKKREPTALNVSGGVATKRNKITDCFKKVTSAPAESSVEDTQSILDISTVKCVLKDDPKVEKLDSAEVTDTKINGLPEKVVGGDNFHKLDISLSKQRSFNDSFSDIDALDSPASRKRKIHIKSLIALLNNENESNKVTKNTTPKDQLTLEVPDTTTHNENELQLKEVTKETSKNDKNASRNVKQTTGEAEKPADFKAELQHDGINNIQDLFDSETKVSLKNEYEAKETSLMPTAEFMKINRLSRSAANLAKQMRTEELQTSKDVDNQVLKAADNSCVTHEDAAQQCGELQASKGLDNQVLKAADNSCVIHEDAAQQCGELQASKGLDNQVLKAADNGYVDSALHCGEKKKYVVFVKRGRLNRLTKRTSFILLGKLTPKERNYEEVGEKDVLESLEDRSSSREIKIVTSSKPIELPINACVQTSPTLMHPSEQKHTLEFVGTEDSQACSIVPDSSENIIFPCIIPLPKSKSPAVLKEDIALCSSSQADDIPTQKFHHSSITKKPNVAVDKNHNEEQKSGSNSGFKMTVSQFSNATTVNYDRNERVSLENSPEICNYSPDKSLTLVEMDNLDEIKDQNVALSKKLTNEVSSGNDSEIRMPFRSNVSRQLKFVPELTDPALDSSPETQTKDAKKPSIWIRSLSSSDSDSETFVPEISDVRSSGGKRVKCDDEEDIEVINLISSQENNATNKAESEILNSSELLAKVMANIEADLAVKRNRTSKDCDESDNEENRDTPIMFSPTEYYGSQIANSCSTEFQPNSAASSEALILGTLQQESQIKIKPKIVIGEKSKVEVNTLPQGLATTNKASDWECESDEGIVQPTPNKDDSANYRNTKTNWVQPELRSMSVGVIRDVFKEPNSVEQSVTATETSSSVQVPKTDSRSTSMNRTPQSAAVEKLNTVQQFKENVSKLVMETVNVEKSNFWERPEQDFQATSKPAQTTSETPVAPKKTQVKLCFVCSGLPASMIAQVKTLANVVDADFSNTFTPNATHLILKDAEDNLAYKTLKYLYAVVKKIWVISFSWVSDSLRAHRLLPEDEYEMLDSSGENGPYKARNSKQLLLQSFEFCCLEPYTDITKDQLEDLLRESGATVVNSPKEITFRSGMHNMILVQMEAKTEEEVQQLWDKYGAITIAHEWVLDSIGRYRVIPIWPYLMSEIEEDHLQALGYPDVLLATDELEPESQV